MRELKHDKAIYFIEPPEGVSSATWLDEDEIKSG
jgi:hypothetical protein